ncbi:hypothetical protein FACS1894200_08800 [Spirochaetia bacterium]|nr:hypothetical protein FACS1894200_08800 [Spirochaetia bacterium]
MPLQKTIVNTSSRKVTLDIPGEVPLGPVILTYDFAPAPVEESCAPSDCPLYAENPLFNAKVLTAIKEGDAWRGEIHTKNIREDIPEAPEVLSTKEMFDEVARRLGYKDHLDYLRANSPATIEEAKAEAARKRKTRKSIYEHYGCLKGEDIYGDGMEYQRMMRDEWSHRN